MVTKNVKNATIVYVPLRENIFGPGKDMPAHVKICWHDDKRRRCSQELGLSDNEIEMISNLPDK